MPVIAWLFSPEDIGRLAMLQVTVSFALLLFTLGLDQAYVREYHEVKDRPGLLRAAFIPGFVFLGFVLVGLIFSPLSVSVLLFGIESAFLTSLFYAAIFLSFISLFLSLILRMQERGMAYSMSQLLPKLLFLVIVLVYVWLGTEPIFKNLLIANFLSLLAVFIVFGWNTRKDWGAALFATIDSAKQYQMIRYAIPLIGGGIAFWGLTAMDKLFLRSISTFDELGVYSVAISFAGAALVFKYIFTTVWVPIVYKWTATGIEPQKFKNVLDYVSLIVVVIWSLAGMLSWVVTYILPVEYNSVQFILLASMAYPLLYTLSEATGIGIGIKRKTIFSMLAAILALIVNAVANWLLIPFYGASGAAIGSALAFFVFFIVRTEVSSRIWVSFERWRMYFFVSILFSLSVFVNVIEKVSVFTVIIYGVVLIAAMVLYSVQTQQAFNFLRKRINLG